MTRNAQGLTRRQALILGAGAALAPAVLAGSSAPARAAAPMMGAARPQFLRFKLGAYEITQLFDGGVTVDLHPIFGNNQPKEAVQKLVAANRLPTEKQQITFSPVLVNTGSALVLFDTGNGPGRAPAAANTKAALIAAGYQPEQVDVVVLTHFHGDHIGGMVDGDKPRYPNARYFAGQVEYDFWTAPERMAGPTEGAAKLVASNVKPFAPKTTFVKESSEVASGIHAVETFGHTPGHVAYHIESQGKRLLIWGDICNHYVASLQRPDWHVGFDVQKDKAAATRKKIFDMASADKLLCAGYHMPFPAVGYVEKSGSGYRWVPAGYELFI